MSLHTGQTLHDVLHEQPPADTDLAVITAMLYHRIGSDRIQEGSSSDLGLLPLHADRLLAAMNALEWRSAAQVTQNGLLHQLGEAIAEYFDAQLPLHSHSIESYKLNIEIQRDGRIHVRAAPLKNVPEYQYRTIVPDDTPFLWPRSDTVAKIHVDTRATETSRFVSHKTSERSFYSDARARAGVGHALPTDEDVLLYDRHGQVLETSCSTIYFRRENDIVVPEGGNQGVTRRLALEKLGVRIAVIKLHTLREGEEIWLSNAVRGYFPGKIVTPQSKIDQAVAGLDIAPRG